LERTNNNEEINSLLHKLIALRKKSIKSKKFRKEFENLQNICAEKLDYLVEERTRRYKSFVNYEDLYQDGRLALHLALQSYNPDKGDFFWWANKYIKTKISREANRHSTIKIPIKKIKFATPYKVSQMPIVIDKDISAFETFQEQEKYEFVRLAIQKLPHEQRRVIELHYEIGNDKQGNNTIGQICKIMKISRMSCAKLLTEAKSNLKQELLEMDF
jgi:RNA polymerase sigma factor (sigma-70 family)